MRRLQLRTPGVQTRGDSRDRPYATRDGIRNGNGRQVDACQAAYYRGSDDTVARWPQPPAALANLARWLAFAALSAVVQPGLAVLLSGARVVALGCRRHGVDRAGHARCLWDRL